jgi:hypothetical protein
MRFRSLLAALFVGAFAFGATLADNATFVRDVNYPDGSSIPVSDKPIVKEWLVRNSGDETWTNRRLVAIGKHTGLVPVGNGEVLSADGKSKTVKPGELALYRAKLTPKQKGSDYKVTYKMEKKVGDKWVLALPEKQGVYILADVN